MPKDTCLMLDRANSIAFTDVGPKYLDMHISYTSRENVTLMELGARYDKLEFYGD